MTEEELKAKFRAFTDAVLRAFQEDLHLVKQRPTKEIIEYNRGSVEWQDYLRPQFGSFFNRRHESIWELDEYDDCIDFAIENYDVISEYHNNRRGLGQILISFVTDVFAENERTLVFSDQDFESVYAEYENDLLSQEFPVRSFIPLHGFSFDGEEIELGSNSRIRRVEESDIEIVTDFESPTGGSVPEAWDSYSTHFLYEFEQTVEKTVNSVGCGDVGFEELDKAKHRIRSVIAALRLTFGGEVGYSNHYDHTPCAWGGGITTRSRTVRPMFHVKSMEAVDTERLNHLYDRMVSIDFESMEPNLKMSIERFNSSYIRESQRVAFADLMIVAEALCSGNDSLSGNALAQRVAIILGDDYQDRLDIFESFSDLYDERSRVWGVAHGGGRTTLDESSLETARSYVKDLLLFFIENRDDYDGHGDVLKVLKKRIEQNHLEVDFPE